MAFELKSEISKIRNNMDCFRRVPELTLCENKKTVMIMLSDFCRGGAERVACHVAAGLADSCNVILLYAAGFEEQYEIDSRVKVICLPDFYYDFKGAFSSSYIRKIKKAYRIDVSLSFMYRMNRLNLLSKSGEFAVVSERNNPRQTRPEHFRGTKIIYALADYVVFQSEEVRAMYRQTVHVHSSVLPNPVAVSCLASNVRKKRIVNAARLVKDKNQSMLIRAFYLFLPSHPGYVLEIYGNGALENELKTLVRELKIENSVFFYGNVRNIHEQIADAGMFVLSSDTEGMSNALLEAMMMGLPCISTSCTGSKEVIKDEYNGLLTEIGNAEAMAEAMTKMADKPELAEFCRKNAMMTAEAFRKDRVMKQWTDLLLGTKQEKQLRQL